MRVRGDGVNLKVRDYGSRERPTVLLVHGYPDTSLVWDDVVTFLRDRYHVVAFDVRGAGLSDRPRDRAAYGLRHLVADLVAVADAVSPDRPVHLVGHDWGSIQGWEAVCTRPDRFASFTSISGPCLQHASVWLRMRLHRLGGLGPALRQLLRSWYIGFFKIPALPELAWRTGLAARLLRRERPLAGRSRTLRRDGTTGLLLYRANLPGRRGRPGRSGRRGPRRTNVPVQVIVASEDRYVTAALAAGAPARRWVPNLWIRHIRAGHWVPLTHPAAIARQVGELIDHVEGAEPARELRRSRRPGIRHGSRKETGRLVRRSLGGRNLDFTNHLVVVTGAGSGIGRATALAFARQGAEVIAADLDLDAARRTAELAAQGAVARARLARGVVSREKTPAAPGTGDDETSGTGDRSASTGPDEPAGPDGFDEPTGSDGPAAITGSERPETAEEAERSEGGVEPGKPADPVRPRPATTHACQVDVANGYAMEDFAEHVRTVHGIPDVVVNNAGIAMAGPFLAHRVDDWERVLAVNLWGVIHGSRLFGAQLAERAEGGHIVNVASAAAFVGQRSLPAYSTSKAAVLMLSECLRADLSGTGVGVSAVCPGFVHTNITRTARFVGRSSEEQLRLRSRTTRLYGLRGFGPERVAERVLAAVRDNRAVAPVATEAHLLRWLSRYSPRGARALARIDPFPR